MPERRNVVLAAMTAIALTLAPSGSTAQIIGEPAHICVQDCAVRTGPVFVDVQAQRLRQLSDRYQQVWQRLKAEGLAVDDLRLPQITPNESLLTLNVDRLHSAAVRNLDVLQMDWDTLPLERTHYERALDSRLDARRDAEDALRKMPARMAGTQANYDRLSKEVTIEESRFRQLDQAANRVRSQEAKTAQSLIYWLGPFLNARDRATLARTIDNRWMPPVETYEKIARLPPPSPAAVAAAPAQPYVFNSRIPPTGPVENKLTGVENVASQIASLRPRVEQESARVTEARRAFEAEREASAGVIERAATAKAQAEKLEATTLALQDRVRDALQNQLHAADNLVRYAAYSYLWSDLKERVVVPAVRDYVTSNGLAWRIPLDDDSMKDLFDKIRDGSPSEFFGLGQTARNIEKLILTERAILDTFKDTRSYIDRAVDVLARGTPQEAQELQNAVFTLLEARSLEITEEATEELPSSVRMVARKALGF